MTDDNVIKLVQPGTFTDPLTEILRNGARALLDAGRRGRGRRLPRPSMPISRPRRATGASCVTGICPSARS